MLQRILCAVDGSEHADHALEFARDLCGATGASLDVVVVWRRPHPVKGGPVVASGDVEDADRAAALGAEAAQTARAAGVEARAHVAVGEAAHAICSAAEELDVDLVVVGTRGHGRLAGVLVGSVSRDVVAGCSRPVTVVRAAPVRAATKT